MDENIRFIQILDDLKRDGVIADYVEAAKMLGTNKAGISDIKSGRKKLPIEILRRMKLSYPSISVEWVITGDGSPFLAPDTTGTLCDASVFIDRIAAQAEEIGRLKARIDQLEHRTE